MQLMQRRILFCERCDGVYHMRRGLLPDKLEFQRLHGLHCRDVLKCNRRLCLDMLKLSRGYLF